MKAMKIFMKGGVADEDSQSTEVQERALQM